MSVEGGGSSTEDLLRTPQVSILAYGSASELLSLVSLLTINLLLPLVVGHELYGQYVKLQASIFLPLALINAPSNVHFLTAHCPPERDLLPMLRIKLLVVPTVTFAIVLSSGGISKAFSASVFAYGLSMLTVAQHLGLLAKDGRFTFRTAVVGALGVAVVPTFGLAVLELSPPSVTAISGCFFAGASLWFLQHSPVETRMVMNGADIWSGMRELASAVARVGPSNYVGTVAGWALVLGVAVKSDAELTASAKLAISIASLATLAIPLSTSIMISATGDGPKGERMLLRIGMAVAITGVIGGAGTYFGRDLVFAPYLERYPTLESLLVFSGALMAPLALNSMLFGLLFTGKVKKRGSRVVSALGVACVVAVALPLGSAQSRLALLCCFAYTISVVTTTALGLKTVAVAMLGVGAAWLLVGSYA